MYYTKPFIFLCFVWALTYFIGTYSTYQLVAFNHKFLFSELHILSMYICNFTFSKLVFYCLLLFSRLVSDTHIIKIKKNYTWFVTVY